MRFRSGLVAGLAIGYVLGAKAGRERYEQIRSAAERLWESQGGKRIRAETARAVDEIKEQAFDAARQMTGRAIDVTDTVVRSSAEAPAAAFGAERTSPLP